MNFSTILLVALLILNRYVPETRFDISTGTVEFPVLFIIGNLDKVCPVRPKTSNVSFSSIVENIDTLRVVE